MSFRSNPGTRQRSSSAIRNNISNNSSYSRPRSLGLFNSNIYSPYTTSSPTKNFLSYNPSSNKTFGSYLTNNYQSPYSTNGYCNNGYASLTIPIKALNNIVPSYSKTLDNTRDYSKNGNVRQSRQTNRTGSFHRERSLSRSHSSMGSRSISLTSLNSLNSEGYVSGTDRSSRSRLGSTNEIRGENGEIDYKKLYEQTLQDNDRLKDKLRKSDEELRETKQTLERLNTVTSKNSLSELEKRERRAMERKLSEMEEELKQLQKLKAENERLRAENRALTRVVSKLTNSANK